MRFLFFLFLIFFPNTSFSISSEEVINRYFLDKKIETVEGIWMTSRGSSFFIKKSGVEYIALMISSPNYYSGSKFMNLYKNSDNSFQGQCTLHNGEGGTVSLKILNQNTLESKCTVGWSSQTISINRIWPQSIEDHNQAVDINIKRKQDELAKQRAQTNDSPIKQTYSQPTYSSESSAKKILKKIIGQ